MARKFLKTNDAAWLFAESVRTPMHVGMLATFRVPEDRPEFVRELVEQYRNHRQFAPPFNYLLRSWPLPGWQELPDDQIDLDYHLRHSALPGPGTQRELGVLVSRLHSAKMDRRYPLWELHVIEGLEGDRWSMYMKVHHSQIDGVGGIRLLRRTLSADPNAREMLPPWAVGTRGPDQSGLLRLPTPDEARATKATTKAIEQRDRQSPVTVASRLGGSLGRTYLESLTGRSEPLRAVPFRAPKSIFNERIHTPRRFATQVYEIDRLKRIATAVDGSLNDVFLALCGGALRRYLVECGKLPSQTLTANVPVSVREGTGASVGNAITFLYAGLGTDIADPVERIRSISAREYGATKRT